MHAAAATNVLPINDVLAYIEHLLTRFAAVQARYRALQCRIDELGFDALPVHVAEFQQAEQKLRAIAAELERHGYAPIYVPYV